MEQKGLVGQETSLGKEGNELFYPMSPSLPSPVPAPSSVSNLHIHASNETPKSGCHSPFSHALSSEVWYFQILYVIDQASQLKGPQRVMHLWVWAV